MAPIAAGVALAVVDTVPDPPVFTAARRSYAFVVE